MQNLYPGRWAGEEGRDKVNQRAAVYIIKRRGLLQRDTLRRVPFPDRNRHPARLIVRIRPKRNSNESSWRSRVDVREFNTRLHLAEVDLTRVHAIPFRRERWKNPGESRDQNPFGAGIARRHPLVDCSSETIGAICQRGKTDFTSCVTGRKTRRRENTRFPSERSAALKPG